MANASVKVLPLRSGTSDNIVHCIFVKVPPPRTKSVTNDHHVERQQARTKVVVHKINTVKPLNKGYLGTSTLCPKCP